MEQDPKRLYPGKAVEYQMEGAKREDAENSPVIVAVRRQVYH